MPTTVLYTSFGDAITAGTTVQHVFHGRYFTVEKVGRTLVHVSDNLSEGRFTFLPTSLRVIH